MRFIGNVEKDGQVRAVASGALSTGDTVVVNSDGTVSVVGPVVVPAEVGSPAVFESAESEYTSVVYDASTSKVVVAYKDGGNSNYGTAAVGTVSGTSISFGTPVVFASTSALFISSTYHAFEGIVVITYSASGAGRAIAGAVGASISFGSSVQFSSSAVLPAATYDSNSQKIVVAYRVNSSPYGGEAVVGTVSGTTLSFGGAATFDSSSSSRISACFDSTNNKVVVFYTGTTTTYGVVGTVSGTSISFGSPQTVDSVESKWTTCAFDSNAGKAVVFYGDKSNGNRATGAVGTVSGTSISFGTSVVADSSDNVDFASAVFSPDTNTVLLSYDAVGNNPQVVEGTVSGTSISFGTPTELDAVNSGFISNCYDSVNNLSVTTYQDRSNSNYGTAVTYSPASTATNLTSENFLGFAAHTYADTQNAVINSTCTVDRNQTGLTAGQKYYVQTNGALGTTAADPSVEAGTAISSTEIIVKG